MCRHWRGCVTGLGLILLAGCAGHYLVQREPWRKEAELACLKSGAVRETGTIVRIEPINGPGMCGADFPLKVAALGEQTLMSYSGLRPPAEVPNAGPQRWPIATAPAAGAGPPSRMPQERTFANPLRPAPVQRQPLPPAQGGAQTNAHAGAPMQILPPQQGNGGSNTGIAVPPEQDDARAAPSASRRPSVFDPPSEPALDDEAVLTPRSTARAPYPTPPRTNNPPQRVASPARLASAPMPVPLGQSNIAAFGPVEVKPAATLACPMVSALDRWIIEAVQPAARRWFRQPVVEIRQISAYSCRGMNAQPGARISEHAFGNALDISAFTLADGRRITVKNGWRGSPEEQGFLRDVQGAACDMFNTVLAPGSNRFHYDHFHFDLMRRRSGNRICNPDQISGEVVAARVARERGHAWQSPSGVTGSIGRSQAKSRAAQNASLGGRPKANAKAKRNILDDDDWIEDDGPRPAE
ncbi:MAG: extensin family protein [Pseudorhodoplanes sp.]